MNTMTGYKMLSGLQDRLHQDLALGAFMAFVAAIGLSGWALGDVIRRNK